MSKQGLGTWRGAGSHAEWGLISSQYMAAGMDSPISLWLWEGAWTVWRGLGCPLTKRKGYQEPNG